MTRSERVTVAASICSLFVLGVGCVAHSAESSVRKTFTISGSVGLPGVTLQGLPGNPVTDQNGIYGVEVPSGWSGTVTPAKLGYRYAPPSRTYSAVEDDLTKENYQATLLTFRISGKVGVAQVAMQGLPGNPVTNPDGGYEVQVPYGWSGTVTPVTEGYVFEPTSKAYQQLVTDMPNENYAARVLTFTISGNVGAPGVAMKGLPGNPITDAKGYYSAKVEYGWAGVVMPGKAGYEFDPPKREYARIAEDLANQDYLGKVLMLTISDVIAIGDEPIPGVAVMVEPGGYTGVTDSYGRYMVEVPYGWSGRLTMRKPGFEFNPSVLPYADVTHHVVDGQAIPASQQPVIPPSRGPSVRPQAAVAGAAGEVVMIPTSQVDPAVLAQVKEDMGVMLQILREKLSEPRTILGVLYDYGDFFGSSGRQVEALYLQGYGALFVMEVSFPLSPALTAGSADGNEPEQAVDPVWQRARQRLYAPPGATYGGRRTAGQADQGSFEQFKEDMVKTLKHAANIRHLTGDESVILTIVGQSEQTASPFGRMPRGLYGGGGPYGGGYVAGRGYSSGGGFAGSDGTNSYSDSSSYGSTSVRASAVQGGRRWPNAAGAASTVLTIQADKADIDAFAQGDLDFEQFSARVKTFSY